MHQLEYFVYNILLQVDQIESRGIEHQYNMCLYFRILPFCINIHNYTLISDPSETPHLSFPDISKTIESYFSYNGKALEKWSRSISQSISSWWNLFVFLPLYILVLTFIIVPSHTKYDLPYDFFYDFLKNVGLNGLSSNKYTL